MIKPDPLQFLKDKGLITLGNNEFIIIGEFGSISLVKLLKEYAEDVEDYNRFMEPNPE